MKVRIYFCILGLLCPSLTGLSKDNSGGLDCPSSFALLQGNLENVSPKLKQFLLSRAVERLQRTQPASFRQLEETIAQAKNGTKNISLDAGEFSVTLTLKKTDDSLTIEIDTFKLKANAGDKGAYIGYGNRSRSLQMGFPRLLTAVCAGLEKQIAGDPNLKKISLKGSNVVNPHLAAQLEEFGFKGQKGSLSKMFSIPGILGILNNFGGLIVAGIGLHDYGVGPRKIATAVVIGVGASKKAIGHFRTGVKSWTLVLDLEKAKALEH